MSDDIPLSKVLVIVPTYNEAENLPGILSELKSNMQCDILVIDDGSKDNTSQVAKKEGVKVLRLPFNLGIGGAVQTGFKYAVQNDYAVAVQVDADGQHNPSSVFELVSLLQTGVADIVIGSRYLSPGSAKTSLIRGLGRRYLSWIASKAVGYRITDCTSGFRAVNKRALDFFSRHYPVDFPDAEALIMAHKNDLKIAELSTQFRERRHGRSSLKVLRLLYLPVKETFSVLMILLGGGHRQA